MSGTLERYQKLRLKESLLRAYDYPSACNELSFILRTAYCKVPKKLQYILFEDTVTAFRVLPRVWTQRGIAAANLLLQAAEVALPKQRRVLAVTEFKHVVVEYKRNCKYQEIEEDSVQLPQDVLVQIFSILDTRSLVAVGLVCWSWNAASNDEKLWQSQYNIFFGSSNRSCESKVHIGKLAVNTFMHQNKEGMDEATAVNWREAFKRAYIGNSSQIFTSNRGYCGQCKSMVWLCNLKCSNAHYCLKHENPQIRPISPRQVVEYLLTYSMWTTNSSDSESDSDSDEGPMHKPWPYGKCIGGLQ